MLATDTLALMLVSPARGAPVCGEGSGVDGALCGSNGESMCEIGVERGGESGCVTYVEKGESMHEESVDVWG